MSLEFGMYQINDQTVLEEDYDENYQPTEEGLLLFVLCIAVLLSKITRYVKLSWGIYHAGWFANFLVMQVASRA